MTDRPNNLARRGFTLTEVLIAMALVAVLLVGIGRIFAITSDTIKTGQAYQAALRKQKAVYTAISKDVLGYASTGNIAEPENNSGMLPPSQQPTLIINNARVATFINQAAAASIGANDSFSNQQNRSVLVRGSDGVNVSLAEYGSKNFRVDSFSFTTRGSFQRQSASSQGGGASYYAPLTSTEAWVWYGHLRAFSGSLADLDNSAAYATPGTATAFHNSGNPNVNQKYAEQFKLGRFQVLLRKPVTARGSRAPTVVGDDGNPQSFLASYVVNYGWSDATNGPTPPGSTPTGWINPADSIYNLGALRNGIFYPMSSVPSVGGSGSFALVYTAGGGRTDHASINTMEGQTMQIANASVDVAGIDAATWRQRIVEVLKQLSTLRDPINNSINNWYSGLFINFSDRPRVNPFPARPYDSVRVAQTASFLADGASQFIVEFAGDFVAQNGAGNTTATGPDGVIDYVVVNGSRQTRWYGLPRDVNGDGIVRGKTSATAAPVPGDSPDVVPVRDVVDTQLYPNAPFYLVGADTTTALRAYAFERTAPPFAITPPAQFPTRPAGVASYTNLWVDGQNNRDTAFSYVCAFGPEEATGGLTDVAAPAGSAVPVTYVAGTRAYGNGAPPVYPKLIRVIVEMRDPAGALGTPVTQEYVFPVPQD